MLVQDSTQPLCESAPKDIVAKQSERTSLGWQRMYLKIVTKKSELVPLAHNIAQLKVHNTLQLQRNRGLPQRIRVLKARQEGVTTYISACNYEDVQRRPNRHAVVVSMDIEGTLKAFRMIRTFHDELPGLLAKPTDASNRKEIVWSKPHRSSVLCQTAGKDVLGRGGTTHRVHATEVAFWANADKQMLGLQQEVPSDMDAMGETCIVEESTACGTGGYFHDKYKESVEWLKKHPDDYNCTLPVFLPWYIMPEYRMSLPPESKGRLDLMNDEPYCEKDALELLASKGVMLDMEQVYWRRYMIREKCNSDLGQFKQEYPATSTEAFQSTGKMVFQPAELDRLESLCKSPIAKIWFTGRGKFADVLRSENCWSVWQYPVKGREYIVFGDVSEGLLADSSDPKSDPDFHACLVFDRITREITATFHGRCDTIEYGQQMAWAGRFWNMAITTPEVNSCGLAVLNELKRDDYPNIFIRQSKVQELIEADTNLLGYKTTVLNRKPSIEMLKAIFRDHDLTLYDIRIVNELRVFVNKNGKPQAEAGYHDDFVMALAGLMQVHLASGMEFGDMPQQQKKKMPMVVPAVPIAGEEFDGGIFDDEDEEDDDGEDDVWE